MAHRLFLCPNAKIFNMFNSNENRPETTGQLEVFSFSQEKSPVRVQLINGEPWFVAKDVCEVLGIANHKDAVSRLDDDERGGSVLPTQFGDKLTNIVSESGLYALIFQSRKLEARKFRKWVTREVLPTIRKKGYYGVRKSGGDYIDARDVPYVRVVFLDSDVRMVEIEGTAWYSINDVHSALGSRKESTQSVRRLNARQTLARKVWLYGVTQPGWFTNALGVKLLMCGCQKSRRAVTQLTLDFGGKEVQP